VDPATGTFDRASGVELPKRFQAGELQAAGSTLWVRGGFTDKKAGIVRIRVRGDGRAVADDPVVLRVPGREDLVAMGGHEVLIATDGDLYRVDIR
jgi:hypothetical protein